MSTKIIKVDNSYKIVKVDNSYKTIKARGIILGSGASSVLIIETPTGAVNGVNNSYTASFEWIPETVIVYRNGQKIHLSQVTLTTSSSFTLEDSPLTGDLIEVQYNKLT
jgi:hypothetical protein